MKSKDIRAMDAQARQKELEGLLREQFNLRMQKSTGQLGNSSGLRKARRDIARLRTIMKESEGRAE
jgi:large subunit ribosomal protein L29